MNLFILYIVIDLCLFCMMLKGFDPYYNLINKLVFCVLFYVEGKILKKEKKLLGFIWNPKSINKK